MPSRDERAGNMTRAGTPVMERVARVIGVLALVLALWVALQPRETRDAQRGASLRFDGQAGDSSAPGASARALAGAIGARIVAFGAQQAVGTRPPDEWPRLTSVVRGIPSAAERAVVGAAVTAGVPLAWRDSGAVSDMAAGASASASPLRSTVVQAQARLIDTVGAALLIRDGGGVLDSTAARTSHNVAARVRAARVQAPLVAQVVRDGRLLVSSELPAVAETRVRDVLLYAHPGWEAKFVAAALEESGWKVEGTLRVSPKTSVRLGAPIAPDTQRYAAIVVLDSGLAPARAVQRFVAQGGGVVLAGDALRDPALASLAGARANGERAAIAGALLTEQPQRGIAAARLVANPAAVVLEREGRDPMVVVTRRDAGRVLATGYHSTWRWRMEGSDDAASDHRRWWNALVETVAMVSDSSASTGTDLANWPRDAAPLADLRARWGPAIRDTQDATNVSATSTRIVPPLWVLFLVAATALLIEWTLRRLRGAP